ncbi:MAG: FAD-dependent oxidoreductase [bacterium]
MKYDALVVGGGIGGMESALKLGDMGYQVLLVEKESSVGGKMILLSKVFPTLDCASCISTPKMGATIHHPNLTVLTYAEVENIRGDNGGFRAQIRQKPRFVQESLCTGCRQCEMVCNVAVPDEFNADMVSRRAAYIAFPQAVPKKAVIERAGTSPCTFNCPAGIKPHGYVALIRAGQYEKAFKLVLEATPLVGSLGRACYAPCEGECTRGSLEGPVSIRGLKRFIADAHYGRAAVLDVETAAPIGKRVAVVGSGPAGLTTAWQLARLGYRVKIFEAAPQPGGMLRLAIPGYRLPNQVVDRDIGNVMALGVEIETDARVEDLDELKKAGYDAIVLASGTPQSARLKVPGEDLTGVTSALAFLRAVKLGEGFDLRGKEVVVIGGGNVAIDAARSARRLGAAAVRMVSLESREEMPAHAWEIEEALAEGIALHNSWGVRELRGEESVQSVELKQCTAVFDADGKFSPRYNESKRHGLKCDAVIVAVGMTPDTTAFAETLRVNRNRTIEADPGTLQTALPYVFAAGDAVSGPTSIAAAVGQGRRAAFMVDRWLQSREPSAAEFDDVLPMVDKTDVLARQKGYSPRPPLPTSRPLSAAPADFAEIEPPLTEEDVLYSAARCLDCGVCSECQQCVEICPADCVSLNMRGQDIEAEVGAVIVATGFKLFPADLKPQYGYGTFKNVITGMQMDRLLAPTRPYNAVLRPSDGKVPDNIAYIMCTGSRDETVDNPLCSKICCMYSVKQNQLIMGALPLADVTVHYMDIRAVGKGYNEFYEQAKAMGANFVKGRVGKITEQENGNLILHYEDIESGAPSEAEYDLVVLAVGVQPNDDARRLFADGDLQLDDYAYVDEPDEDLNPGRTNIPGVYVAGAASGVKDIPDSILHAGAAVAQAAAHLERAR